MEYPDIFKYGYNSYKNKSSALADAEIGWHLCQTGEKLPEYFKVGADWISQFVGEEVTIDNASKLLAKYKIKEDRAARGLTQVSYAELFNVSEQTVKSWEGGHRTPGWYMGLLTTFSTEALQVAGAKARR